MDGRDAGTPIHGGTNVVYVRGDCMDWRNNIKLNKELSEGDISVRTAGGNVDTAMPTFRDIVRRENGNGNKVVIDDNMHTECGEKGYCFDALRRGTSEGVIGDRIVGRYKDVKIKSKQDMCKTGMLLTHSILSKGFAKEIAAGTVEVKVGLTITKDLNAPMDMREDRLMITKTNRGFTYDRIGRELGFGAHAYYLHANSINEIIADAMLSHKYLKLNDISIVAFSDADEKELVKWKERIEWMPEIKTKSITLERVYDQPLIQQSF
ncbi:MAG TPA: hypothetical protein VMV00_00240 [Candidatus Baltobacteraceae bacterium]|nr:hypothetical protein [Candidatus Baltobacteraceae bacterium]